MASTRRDRGVIRFWLVVYLLAGAFGGLIVITSPIGFVLGDMDATELLYQIVLTLGGASPVIGAILALRVRRAATVGLFLKATTTIRVTAVTWVAFPAVAYLIIAIVGPQDGQSVNVSAFVLLGSYPEAIGLFGAATLLLLIGPGLAEYRIAREQMVDNNPEVVAAAD